MLKTFMRILSEKKKQGTKLLIISHNPVKQYV